MSFITITQRKFLIPCSFYFLFRMNSILCQTIKHIYIKYLYISIILHTNQTLRIQICKIIKISQKSILHTIGKQLIEHIIYNLINKYKMPIDQNQCEMKKNDELKLINF